MYKKGELVGLLFILAGIVLTFFITGGITGLISFNETNESSSSAMETTSVEPIELVSVDESISNDKSMPSVENPIEPSGSSGEQSFELQNVPMTACGSLHETTYLIASETATGSCMTIDASDFEFDCRGFSITFGTLGASGVFGIGSTGAGQHNVTIKNCVIIDGSEDGDRHNGISLNANYQNCTIQNNTFTVLATGVADDDHTAIYLDSSSNNLITGNTINIQKDASSSIAEGIYIYDASYDNNITDNVIKFPSGGGVGTNYMMYFNVNTSAIINNNNLSKASGTASTTYGMYFSNTNNNTLIDNNNISLKGKPTVDTGIYYTSFNFNNINITNNFIEQDGYSIYLASVATAGNIRIEDNAIDTDYGILLYTPSTTSNNNFYLKDNDLKVSEQIGIELDYNQTYLTIDSNNITINASKNNLSGIQVISPSTSELRSTIYDSVIQNNKVYITSNATTKGNFSSCISLDNVMNSNISGNTLSYNSTVNSAVYDFIISALNMNGTKITGNTITTKIVNATIGIFVNITNATKNNQISNNDISITSNISGLVNKAIYFASGASILSDNLSISNNKIAVKNGTDPLTIKLGIINASSINGNNITLDTAGYLISVDNVYDFNNNEMNDNILTDTNYSAEDTGIYLSTASGIFDNILINNNVINVNRYGVQMAPIRNLSFINNNLTVNSTTGAYGFYTSSLLENVSFSNNSVIARATAGTHGFYTSFDAYKLSFINNSVDINGTTNDAFYIGGDYLYDSSFDKNTIFINGSSDSNMGIYLLASDQKNTNVTHSVMNIYGKTRNIGLSVVLTTNADISDNSIFLNCTTTYSTGRNCQGIKFTTSSSNISISNQNITIKGVGYNDGIKFGDMSNLTCNSNKIIINGTSQDNYGINFDSGTDNLLSILNNNIVINGSGNIYGAILTSVIENSTFSHNSITTNSVSSGAVSIVAQGALKNSSFVNNTLIGLGTTAGYGFYTTSTLTDIGFFNNTIKRDGTSTTIGFNTLNSITNLRFENNSINVTGTSTLAGFYSPRNVSGLNLDKNTIFLTGTDNTYGVYLKGISTSKFFNNINITNSAMGIYGSYISSGTYIDGLSNGNISNNDMFVNCTAQLASPNCVNSYFLSAYDGNVNITFENNNLTGISVNNSYGLKIVNATNFVCNKNNITLHGSSDYINGINLWDVGNKPVNKSVFSNNLINTSGLLGSNIGIYYSNTEFKQNVISGNQIFVNGTGSDYGIIGTDGGNNNFTNNFILVNGTAVTGANSGLSMAGNFNRVIDNFIETGGSYSGGYALQLSSSNTTLFGNNLTSKSYYAIYFASSSSDNKMNNTIMNNPKDWIYAGATNINNTLTNTSFISPNGSIRLNGSVFLNESVDVTKSVLNITYNHAFMNSTNITMFNTTAQITFSGLTKSAVQAIVDFEDDGTYETCSICDFQSYSGGVFVFNTTHFTDYSSNSYYDLKMPKDTILCTAEVYQDDDAVDFYTCGDVANVGGDIVCDSGDSEEEGGTGDSSTNPTNATSCQVNQSNGAFVVCNDGDVGQLNATLTNITIGGISGDVSIDHYIFNAINNTGGSGCNSTNCNKCPSADTDDCYTTADETIDLCEFFDPSGSCLCQCFSIHITNITTISNLKSGEQLVFVVKDDIITTALADSGECT